MADLCKQAFLFHRLCCSFILVSPFLFFSFLFFSFLFFLYFHHHFLLWFSSSTYNNNIFKTLWPFCRLRLFVGARPWQLASPCRLRLVSLLLLHLRIIFFAFVLLLLLLLLLFLPLPLIHQFCLNLAYQPLDHTLCLFPPTSTLYEFASTFFVFCFLFFLP